MKIAIKRIDKSLPIPEYQTKGACAFDIYARETTIIPAKQIVLIPSNLIVKVPEGYMLNIFLRSSSPRKKGLSMPHGVGVIDQDYHGDDDEIKVQVLNHSDREAVIERGERIAQAVFTKIDKFDFEETEDMKKDSRGGFGSTG